jgi:hypothetical protein
VNSQIIKNSVENWLSSVVIDLNLCPFAQREYRQNKVRFSISNSDSDIAIINDLSLELSLLEKDEDIETTLLILPNALQDFLVFNDFLEFVDQLIDEMSLAGVFQIASFHPGYQFGGTNFDDPENYTNRAPFPILHILRENSLEQAIERHPDTERIPEENIALMNKLGRQHMASLLAACSSLND